MSGENKRKGGIGAERIRQMFVVRLTHDGKREYQYNDPGTEREFHIRRSGEREGSYRYLLEEMTPNGRMVEFDARGYVRRAWEDPRIREAEQRVGPNGLMAELRLAGVDRTAMVFIGAGYGVNSVLWDSLDECAHAIARALQRNRRYVAYRRLSRKEKAELARRVEIDSRAYWQWKAKVAEAAQGLDVGLFKGCHTMLGKPLDGEVKREILTYLNAPSQDLWLCVRNYCIAGGITLWQAWCAIDPAAPQSGNSGFPTPETVRRAIRDAVRRNESDIAARLAALA